MNDIILVLQAIERGESKPLEELLPLVYQGLRRMMAEPAECVRTKRRCRIAFRRRFAQPKTRNGPDVLVEANASGGGIRISCFGK